MLWLSFGHHPGGLGLDDNLKLSPPLKKSFSLQELSKDHVFEVPRNGQSRCCHLAWGSLHKDANLPQV